MSVCSNKLLVGKKAILEYLQFSEPVFFKFVNMGMPVRVIDNRYYAHTDNLDGYFKRITFCKAKVNVEAQ